MNKITLKKFAVDSRKELIEKIQIKALQYGIEKDKIKNSQAVSSDSIVINGKPLSKEEKLQREKLIERIKSINEEGGDGYKDIIEEVAYTWFNRFTALRFMEINNYLPTRVRALSSSTPGNVEPDLIKEASSIDLNVDKQKIYEMKINSNIEGLFKYLIIAQCNALNKSLPFMFEKIGHYTELLFPDGLLNENAFIRNLTDIELIPESDWEDVEIIGWLYQYYISEEKDRVIEAKKRYKKDEIPFATQLFTPDWIVRYMVQNTLGKYWIESHTEHSDLKKGWEFYLENLNPEPDFEEKLKPYINRELKVEDIKCFDPAMGSGHILVYMFDVLYEIYEKCGYMSREIPQLIIENNLYGLDIDDRAYQLACFAVIMRGMKYNNRLLKSIEREAERSGKEGIKLNIVSIQETNKLNEKDIEYIAGEKSGENFEKTKRFILQFKNAKIFGSLTEIMDFDKEYLKKRLEHLTNNPVEHLEYQDSKNKQVDVLLNNLIIQAEIMSQTYEILVTNPPYIGNRYLNSFLSDYIGEKYRDVKSDIFSAFIVYSFSKVKDNGQIGFMTPFVWMFIQSYEKLREFIIREKNISSLVQLEYSGFDEATVPICTFTLRNYNVEIPGEYIRLSDFKGAENQPIKTIEAVKNSNVKYRYSIQSKYFHSIPGSPIAYWASDKVFSIFDNGLPLGDFAKVKRGMTTSDNNRFLRYWPEICITKFCKNAKNDLEALESKSKWFPYSKGGGYRKWYGYLEYLINWENSGYEVIEFAKTINKSYTRTIVNISYYFMPSIGFSYITSVPFSLRWIPEGCLYDSGGPGVFADEDKRLFILGCMNSKPAQYILKILNPTINLQIADVVRLPLPNYQKVYGDKLFNDRIKQMIELSKNDWDSFETSWDFKKHPILDYKNNVNTVKEAYDKLAEFIEKEFYILKENEEELNRIFIYLYGFEDEMILLRPGRTYICRRKF
jgi:hypothetical protein